jgi:hypothetical protein
MKMFSLLLLVMAFIVHAPAVVGGFEGIDFLEGKRGLSIALSSTQGESSTLSAMI